MARRKIDTPKRLRTRATLPTAGGGPSTAVGRCGRLGSLGRKGAAWVRGAGPGSINTSTGRTIAKTVSRGFPWIVGGSIAWEIGRQISTGVRDGKVYDESGNVVGTLADGCVSLNDLLSDPSQVKRLVKDLQALKGISAEDSIKLENSSFFTEMKSGSAPYSMNQSGAVLVTCYAGRRLQVGTDYLFDPATLVAIYFNAIYCSCFDPSTGLIPPPEEMSYEELMSTLREVINGLVDDSNAFDGCRQLVELDAWLKLTEWLDRVRSQGRSPQVSNEEVFEGFDSSSDPWSRPVTGDLNISDDDGADFSLF